MRILITLFLFCSACSIVNAPDEANLDAGVDALDAMDAMDADGGVDAPPPVEICTNGIDDDENGLVDCQDFACDAEPQCCSAGTQANVSLDGWELSNGLRRQNNIYSGQGFVQNNDCSAVFRGNVYQIPFALPNRCENDRCRLGLVGSVINIEPGAPSDLRQEFAAELVFSSPNTGELFLRSTERTVASSGTFSIPRNGTLEVTLTPGEVDGELGLHVGVTVFAGDSPSQDSPLIPPQPLLQNSNLIRRCGDRGPGLHLGVRLNGSATIGQVIRTDLSCSNPVVFLGGNVYVAGDTTEPLQSLGLRDYAAGSIQSPGLLVEASDEGAELVMVLSGSTLPPDQEGVNPDFSWDVLRVRSDINDGRLGVFREPPVLDAFEGEQPDVINANGLAYASVSSSGLVAINTSGFGSDGCTPIQPAFGTSVPLSGLRQYELFFLCGPSLYVSWFQVNETNPTVSGPILTFEGATPIDFDVVDAWEGTPGDERVVEHSIWVLLEDSRGDTSLHLYRGRSRLSVLTVGGAQVYEADTSMVAFPGNPVLRSDDLALGGAQIESVAVARHNSSDYFMFGYEASGEWRILSRRQAVTMSE